MKHRYSTVSQYTRCPRLFKLEQIDQIPTTGPRSAALEFGSAMHLGIEGCLLGRDGEEIFTIYWNSLKGKDLSYDRDDWKALLNTGQTLQDRFKRLHAKRCTPTHLERTIEAHIRNVSVIGTPDFLGDFDGVPSIVDWKTTAYPYHKGRLTSGDQLAVYAELARLGLGYEAKQKVYFQFVKGSKPQITVHKAPIDPESQKLAIDNFVLLCQRIETDTQFPQHRGSCVIGRNVCSMFEVCFGKN